MPALAFLSLCISSYAERQHVANAAELVEAIAGIKDHVSSSAKMPSHTGTPGALPHPSHSWEETRLAMVSLQAAKAENYLEGDTPDVKSARTCIALARWALNMKPTRRPPGFVRDGFLVEHAFFARNDRSPQPYFVYAPAALLSSSDPCPLLVLLHGWVPDTSVTNPWLPPKEVVRMADDLNVIIAIPHGRTNTDFQYAGEVDVIRVISEMQTFYPVDENRVYLVGPSMGGAGVWQIAMHYPDIFAAIAPINAQGDWFKFWHEHFNYPVRKQLPNHVEWLLSMHNPVGLASNLRDVFSYSQHATKCFVGVEHTRSVSRVLTKHNIGHEFFEDPSSLGHFTYWEKDCWERSFRRVVTHKRVEDPERINYRTFSLRFPGAYWAKIARIKKWGREATIDAYRDSPGRLTISTTNVAALILTPRAQHSAPDGTFSVTWNEKTHAGLKPQADGSILLSPPAATNEVESAFSKNRAVCGPASDVFNFPFVGIYGTQGTKQDVARSRALADQFASDWHGYAEGKVSLVADTEVTDEIMSSAGLILFGPPESNKIIGKVLPHLPFKLRETSIEFPDGKRYSGEDLGYVITYPNPLAPDRYIMIYSGSPWGSGRSKNHKFDLLPDFCVFTTEVLPGTGINRYLAAGLFDETWQYDPLLTDFGKTAKE